MKISIILFYEKAFGPAAIFDNISLQVKFKFKFEFIKILGYYNIKKGSETLEQIFSSVLFCVLSKNIYSVRVLFCKIRNFRVLLCVLKSLAMNEQSRDHYDKIRVLFLI